MLSYVKATPKLLSSCSPNSKKKVKMKMEKIREFRNYIMHEKENTRTTPPRPTQTPHAPSFPLQPPPPQPPPIFYDLLSNTPGTFLLPNHNTPRHTTLPYTKEKGHQVREARNREKRKPLPLHKSNSHN